MTAAEALSVAAFKDGKYSQAFGAFGPERRGAPVMSFCRIDDKLIRLRQQVYEPDVVVVLDPSLLNVVNVYDGLKKGGSVVFNNNCAVANAPGGVRVFVVDATKIAKDVLGRPIVNTAMLGAYVKATGDVNVESLIASIKERFPGKLGEKNEAAIRRAYEETKEVR